MRKILLALAIFLTACADRDGAIRAARELAEASYPGQLELYDTRLQKDHYDIILAIRGDPITRIRFAMDRDPARCQPGTPCEERLHRAYATGVADGARLKALNHVFRQCGVPLLAVDGADRQIRRMVVELELGETDQQPALDQLSACVQQFRAIDGDAEPIHFHILRRKPHGPAAMPDLVTFETGMPEEYRAEAGYLVSALPGQPRIAQEKLRIDSDHVRNGAVAKPLQAAARDWLATQVPGAELPEHPAHAEIRLDPHRLDIVRVWLMACGQPAERGNGRCTQDLAVRIAFDMQTGEAGEWLLLRIAPEKGEPLRLPALPGR